MRSIQNHDVKIFTDNIETTAIEQIEQLLTIPAFSGCKIRIMPDVHAGAGCVIGFTGDLGDKVIPNIVGVDIGCGIMVQPFSCINPIDFHSLNEFILRNIPSGRNHRNADYAALPEKYIGMYVACNDCRSPNTVLERDHINKLYFVICKSCGSKRSVAAIKTGYHAVKKGERYKSRQ